MHKKLFWNAAHRREKEIIEGNRNLDDNITTIIKRNY
jgi:hypothetical protein